ncbi:hypothetical protein [Pedobacter endophyticus]|uniref:Uncharacterized protein n=1 Tax=Pedobacter endophyticus TaxID=2789740 RepID=A0A7S9L117_9SPHI|nr:hypothetical protein [Pedobacter endophyticus]QPH40530.1 hypothetical protein IZT61_04415 [Pedobacter endophyticus]
MSAEENNQDETSTSTREKPIASGVRSEYRHYEGDEHYAPIVCESKVFPSKDENDKPMATTGSRLIKWIIFLIALALAAYFMSR